MAQPGEQDLGLLLEALQTLQSKQKPLLDRLRAIDEKKSTTAPQIYEKVRKETLDKLTALEDEARGHRAQALLARDVVSGRRAEVDREVSRLNEELEEIRFRNTLGEFTAEEFQRAESTKLAEVRNVEGMGASLVEYATLLDTLLEGPPPAADVAAAAAAGAPAPAPPPPAPPSPPSIEDERPPADHTRPQAVPSLVPSPAPSARVAAPEMEALFGSVPPPSLAPAPPPPRPSLVPPPPAPPRSEPLAPFPGAVVDGAAAERPRVPLAPEETTQDLGIRTGQGARSGPAFPAAQAAAAVRPVLIVKTKDKDRGEDTYDLAGGQTLIGRAPENDIILLEESVSRRHARILVDAAECSIEDLGSANGSYVNGEKLRPKQPRKLQDNDVVKMGQLLALFRLNPED